MGTPIIQSFDPAYPAREEHRRDENEHWQDATRPLYSSLDMLLRRLPTKYGEEEKNPFLKTDLQWVCSFNLTVSFHFDAVGKGRMEERRERRR